MLIEPEIALLIIGSTVAALSAILIVRWLKRDIWLRRIPADEKAQLRKEAAAREWLETALRKSEQRADELYQRLNLERNRAEAEWRESEARFRSAFDFAAIGMALVSTDGRWLQVNRSLCEILGYSEQELLARRIQDINHPDDIDADSGHIRRLLAGEINHYQIEKRYFHKQGHAVWALLSVSVVRNGQGDPLYFILQVHDITDRQREAEHLENSRAQLRALSARLQMVREEERGRIAREIHDELGQVLTGLKIDISSLAKHLLSQDGNLPPPGLAERTRSITELIDSAIQTVRKISSELRPGLLYAIGLIAAVEWQVKEFQNRTGILCKLKMPSKDVAPDEERSIAVFRIFQEILTNIARHADATRVDITLEERGTDLILKAQDNGRGIKASEFSNPKSLGLLGMRERALLLGGEVNIRGAQGKGTTVTVRIPLGKTPLG